MGKKTLFLVLALLIVVFTGCIDYENTFSLNNDGSGKVHIHYWLTEDVAKQMKSNKDASDPLDEAQIKKNWGGKDLSIGKINIRDEEKITKATEEGKEDTKTIYKHVEFDIKFPHISKLSNAPEFSNWKFDWAAADKLKLDINVTPANKEGVSENINTYTAIFKFPGNVVKYSDNGVYDKKKPKQVVYKIDVGKLNKEGWKISATAEKGTGGGGIGIVPIIVIVGVILLIIIIAVVAGGKKKQEAPAPSDE